MSLYDPKLEKDNCGFGMIANMEGEASHKLVRTAIGALDRMQHRGGISADGKTGDGCGLLLQKPDSFFRAIAKEQGWNLSRHFAVGTLFLSQDPNKAAYARALLEQALKKETLELVAWRVVPINPDLLGPIAKASLPQIEQVFINAPTGWIARDIERRLYIARRQVEKQLEQSDPDFYIASLSNLVTIYKGLVMPGDLPKFYLDLADIRMQSAICLFHQRFSTNTSPKWPLAQPFRFLAHNGEINTITGNRQWARARAYKFASPLLPDMASAAPFVNDNGSDSSSLDNMLELFLAGGMDLFRAFRLLIPPAWQKHPLMDDELRAFYDFNSMHMEPWDGPAGIVMTDGRFAACGLDRNGLRPSRYVITSDKLITLASEVGIWDYSPDEVLEKGRVGPGELLVIDTKKAKLWTSFEIDQDLRQRHPYRQWLNNNCRSLLPFEQIPDQQIGDKNFDLKLLASFQKQFNYSLEEEEQILRVLAESGQEATGSMGDDTPMAVLSTKPRSIYDYFRQKFAQVTNPPIDPLRENHVMSLATCIGREQNVFQETGGHADRLNLASPILVYSDLVQLKALDEAHYRHACIRLDFSADEGLEAATLRVTQLAIKAVKAGTVQLILTDRFIDQNHLPIPAPMAVGAIHHALVQANLRCDANILVETASARDPHQFALLLGFGATAIYPYLAYETLAAMIDKGSLNLALRKAMTNYRKGIEKGLLKIMSKMGISTIASYRCSQLFEAVGLHSQLTELCFNGVASRVQGANFKELQQDLERLSQHAWSPRRGIDTGGLLKYVNGGEYHAFNPNVVMSLQQAVKTGDYADYQDFAKLVNQRPTASLRDLLQLVPAARPIELASVEPASALYQRFDTAAMSIGALSPEAHESLAIAMNQLGGRSNSGEGGEDPKRFGSQRNSRIKQIASGRFGVTAHYLMSADVVQIKVAQGAKPGEGGQLPGNKVSAEIAKLRYSVPGVTLISPPPHHDIYSIEDLAQLIFDIKQLKPSCLVSVKLVSEPGVGTIATGVAKAYADLITISGYDGGTAASPLTSVKYAGSPWELGLSETHHALVANNLRHKVRLQVDGGLKTGLDVIKAAILGAESFGFGTGPMVALGCKFLRICHLNNCATGVATQDIALRNQFYKGLPERVVHYFTALARETRELMAQLGVTQLTELLGRSELLNAMAGATKKQQQLDLSALLEKPISPQGLSQFCQQDNKPFDKGELNLKICAAASPAVQNKQALGLAFDICNTDRSVGAMLSGMIAKQHGNHGMAASPITIRLTGTAGQSFGVWNVSGLEMHLIGDANDYVGKGMTGGKLIIHPHVGVNFASHQASIIGNTCLYGATGGYLYASGCAGERFAVRNSGAKAVVEGLGDNGCEYMTGGCVTVLGQVGVNFGAGMTGGFAYVLDEDNSLAQRLNTELVEALSLSELSKHQEHLRGIVNSHFTLTGSQRAEQILVNFSDYLPKFKLIKPKSTDIEQLLGRKSQDASQLIIEAQ